MRALISGIYAIHLINAVRERAVISQGAEREYKRWVGEIFDRTIGELRSLQENQPFGSEFQAFTGPRRLEEMRSVQISLETKV